MKSQFYKKFRNKLKDLKKSLFNLKLSSLLFKRIILFLYRSLYALEFFVEKKILLLRTRLKYGKLYFNKDCWINPWKIQFFYRKDIRKLYNYLRIIDGDWDRLENEFEDIKYYQAFKKRFKEGKKWEDTEFYNYHLNLINKGEVGLGPKSKEKLDARLRKFESLYEDIKKNSFKPKKELISHRGYFRMLNIHEIFDDIAVYIGRYGDILVQHGRHRLSMAKLLELPKVPIIIIARHKKWMDFRKHLISFSKNHQVGPFNEILTHPDLQKIPFKKDNESFNLIIKNISISNGKVLDIGAQFGYFCHILEDKGFDCYAIEENRDFAFFLKKLRKIEGKKFKIITKSIFDDKKNQDLIFDIVLALNILPNLLKTKESYLNLINFLKRLQVKELFFGIYDLTKFRYRTFYRNFSLEQFVNFVIKKSSLSKAHLICELRDGRKIYKFMP